MNELQRQVYLEVMGVDSYFPRLQLPGAEPSKQCVLPVIQKQSTAISATTQSKVIGGSSLLDSFEQNETPDYKPEQAALRSPISTDDHQVLENMIPRFTLTAISGGSDILIVDQGLDKHNGSINPAEYLQLLQNMLFAIGIQKTALSQESFIWPVIEGNQIDQTEEAAKQVLEVFIAKLLNQQQIKYLLVMGADAKHYLSLNDFENGALTFHPNWPVQVLTTDSALDMLVDPLMKKPVWQDLQAFLQHSERDH